MSKRKLFISCQRQRRWLESRGKLNYETGALTEESQQWVEGACSIPLFSETERETGICRSCSKGWSTALNHPIEDKAKYMGVEK